MPNRNQNGASDNCPARATGARAAATQIVLIDDDDLFRESLGLNLIDEGYEVASFSGGAAALDYFALGDGLVAILRSDGRAHKTLHRAHFCDERKQTDGTLDGVAGELDSAIVEEAGEPLPARERIPDRRGERALAAELASLA
jgi:hypothetical protein